MIQEPAPSVRTFFESYRTVFERLDPPAIADHFTFPLHLTGDAEEINPLVIPTRQRWIEQVEQLLDMYGRIGFASARILDLTTVELSPRLILAVVNWGLHDAAGRALYEFQAAYTLAEVKGELRIAAIAHNEITRSRPQRTSQT